MKKYELQHTGKPYASAIPSDAWKHLSWHASAEAAERKIWKLTADCNGEWNDHYRIVAPDGSIVDRNSIWF